MAPATTVAAASNSQAPGQAPANRGNGNAWVLLAQTPSVDSLMAAATASPTASVSVKGTHQLSKPACANALQVNPKLSTADCVLQYQLTVSRQAPAGISGSMQPMDSTYSCNLWVTSNVEYAGGYPQWTSSLTQNFCDYGGTIYANGSPSCWQNSWYWPVTNVASSCHVRTAGGGNSASSEEDLNITFTYGGFPATNYVGLTSSPYLHGYWWCWNASC
jgi:hypothetical protein